MNLNIFFNSKQTIYESFGNETRKNESVQSQIKLFFSIFSNMHLIQWKNKQEKNRFYLVGRTIFVCKHMHLLSHQCGDTVFSKLNFS